jgi:hypothetical protein
MKATIVVMLPQVKNTKDGHQPWEAKKETGKSFFLKAFRRDQPC